MGCNICILSRPVTAILKIAKFLIAQSWFHKIVRFAVTGLQFEIDVQTIYSNTPPAVFDFEIAPTRATFGVRSDFPLFVRNWLGLN